MLMTEKHGGLGPLASKINFSTEIPRDIPKGQTGIPTLDAANKIEKLIYNDTLTNFENRRGLNRYKESLREENYPLTLVTFDLDNLKKINDNPDPQKGGHAGGDRYILSFVKFINEVFPDVDIKKFRLGGDEFSAGVPQEQLSVYQEKLNSLDQLLKEFNDKEGNPNALEFTYAIDTASSNEDFYPALKRSDDKLVEAKKTKKDQQNLSSNPSISDHAQPQ